MSTERCKTKEKNLEGCAPEGEIKRRNKKEKLKREKTWIMRPKHFEILFVHPDSCSSLVMTFILHMLLFGIDLPVSSPLHPGHPSVSLYALICALVSNIFLTVGSCAGTRSTPASGTGLEGIPQMFGASILWKPSDGVCFDHSARSPDD